MLYEVITQKTDSAFAADVALQIYDNAMIQAGLVVDPLVMVERNYVITSYSIHYTKLYERRNFSLSLKLPSRNPVRCRGR